MAQINTYAAQHFVSLSGYSDLNQTVFQCGIAKRDAGIIGTQHAFKSFAFFDSAQMTADLHQRRVTKITLNITTDAGVEVQNDGTVPIRLYQTSVSYDASKRSKISADTFDPAAGMSYQVTSNEYFIRYWESEAVEKNAELVNSQLCAGDEADQLARALCAGTGIGTFVFVPNGKIDNNPYKRRRVTAFSITVYSETMTSVTAPTEVIVIDREAAYNSTTVRLSVKGAEFDPSNPITGYKVRGRYKLSDSSEWSAWDAATTTKTNKTDAIANKTVSIPGSVWEYMVCTTSAQNDSEYVAATGCTVVASNDPAKVSLFNLSVDDYTTNGTTVLHPTECTATEQAGGSYEVSMQLPLVPGGEWEKLQTGYLVKVRVPVPPTERTMAGDSLEIWRNKLSSNVGVYTKAKDPTPINYAGFSPTYNFRAGMKVSLHVNGHRNWMCIKDYPVNATSTWRDQHRPDNAEYWKAIPDYTSVATVTTLSPQQEFYKLQDYNSAWLRISTYDGSEGYVKKQNVEYVRTEATPAEDERRAKEQLFRIYDINVDTAGHKVSVSARHVSYDLSGNIIKACKVTKQSPSMAISLIKNTLLHANENIIATNLNEDDGLITQDYSWKNPSKALLDPDTGIVGICKAKVIRDNWDIFILKNTETDRGIVLSYGKNLKGVTWKRNADQLVTRVIPFAKGADKNELLLDEVYVDSPMIESWPVVKCERLSVDGKVGDDDGDGGQWTVETLKEHMRQKAEERFSVQNADKESIEITVDFVLLGDTEEYRQYRGLQKLYMYDMVRIIDERIGLQLSLQVSRIDWDCIHQRYKQITLGNTFDFGGRSTPGYSIANGGIDFEKLNPSAVQKIRNEVV